MANKENLANGILAADITDTDTQITLDSGYGASDMPSAPFYATITLIGVVSNKSNSEIVYVTDVTGDTLTVVRGQRGTVAKSFPSGSIVANGFYVEDLEDFVESDTTDRFTVSDTEPANPTEGDVWIDTNELPEELAPTSIVWKERPAGDVDGVNRTFQTNQPYISGSLQVFINGIAQSQLVDESGAGSGVFELDTAPLIGDDITVQYQVRTVATGNADTLDGAHLSAILEAIYPVGAVFVSGSNTMPALIDSIGTWERIQGRFIVGASDTDSGFAVNNTGGSKTHNHLQTVGANSYNLYVQSANPNGSTIVNNTPRFYLGNTQNTGAVRLDYTYDSSSLPPFKAKYMWERVA